MTARYSPIAPIAILERLQDIELEISEKLLGNYLLLLAHDVLEHAERYRDLCVKVRDNYSHMNDTFIIMDNSMVELGKPMDIDHVIAAAMITNADCIMTPDVLGDADSTRRLIAEVTTSLLTCGFPLMRVPQGPNNGALVECVEWIRVNLPIEGEQPEYWGIPRWIATVLGSRIPIVQYINMTSDNARIHLLGTSTNFEDDCRCAMLPNVMGIDSANPLVMGYAGIDISQIWQHMERGNYWDITHVGPQVINNIGHMRRAILY